MEIIKESTGKYGVLRTDTYANSLAHFEMLFAEAKKDFPSLEPGKVEVIRYGGDRYARTHGIEFLIPEGAIIPPEYQPIENLELVR